MERSAAGVAKLRHSGLAWVFSDNFSTLLIQANYLAGSPPRTNLGLHLAQHPLLCRFSAGSSLLLETGLPLALFSRRLRWILVPGCAILILGMPVLLGPFPKPILFCYLFWVPWDLLGVRLAGHETNP